MRFLLPSHLGLLSEEQLWSTGHRQMICQTGGGSGKRQGEERVKRFETGNLSNFVVEPSSIQ